MSSDATVLDRIKKLVDEEHELRAELQDGQIAADTEHRRLRDVEVELDQCWDLLRQRRALKESGQDPDSAQARPGDQVEGYLG